MPFRSLLSNYRVLRSSDPELVRECLFRVFGATHFDGGQHSEFAVRASLSQVGGLGLSYSDFASEVSIGFGEASFVRQIFNIQGAGRYAAGKLSGEIAPGSCSPVLPAQTPLRVDFKPHYCQLVLRIELDALRRYLSALLGRELSEDLVFDESSIHHPAMRSLRRRIFHFADDFNERGAFFSDLAAAEVERMVIMKFLMCHRHNYSHLLLREPPQSAPSAVRRVEEFIEANWDQPIDIQAMSTVAQVSARSLFRQFSKDRGYSPADFAKRIRLNRARELLEQSPEGASVTQIALKCGFQNPGHFARDFRLTFGELPSETLKKSARRLNPRS
jgi:AraC-like DNA-binding protein